MSRTSTARSPARAPSPSRARAQPAGEVVPKAEQSRRTRDLIIETGMRCLATYGYAQTTMLLISKEAGISRGPLQYHFKDKNDLMAAIAEALPMQVTETVRQRLRSAVTIEARLTTVIDIALEEHTGRHHFVAMELLMAARNDPALAAAIGPHLQRGEAAIDDWWTDYLAMHGRSRADLLALRHVVVACLRGLALDHILQQDAQAHANALQFFRSMFLTVAQGASKAQRPEGG